MKKITFPIFLLCLSQQIVAQCDSFTVPYTATTENALLPGLPDCMTSNYTAFTSDAVFVSTSGPVAGFSGKLLSYDTYTGSEGGGAMMPTIGAELYTNKIILEQGTQYVISYRYANSDAAKTIGRFGVQLQQPDNGYYQDIATHLNVTGATVTNAVSAPFTVPATGDYTFKFDVESFENQGKFYLDDISVKVSGVMAVGQNLLPGTMVYPNPTNSRLTINSENQLDKIEIYNITGQRVSSEPVNALSHEVDMSKFSAGIYIVTLHWGGAIKKVKIYKE